MNTMITRASSWFYFVYEHQCCLCASFEAQKPNKLQCHICYMNGLLSYCSMWCEISSLLWRHNDRDGVSNHKPHDCLLNRLFRRRSRKTSKLRVTGLCEGNSPVTGEFLAQRASNAEDGSIWWRHHDSILCGILQYVIFKSLGVSYSNKTNLNFELKKVWQPKLLKKCSIWSKIWWVYVPGTVKSLILILTTVKTRSIAGILNGVISDVRDDIISYKSKIICYNDIKHHINTALQHRNLPMRPDFK